MPDAVGPTPSEATVQLAFRTVLHREPDPGGLATYAAALEAGHDLPWLLEILAASDEYRGIGRLPGPQLPFPLDSGPPMAVQPACDPAGLQALWDRVAQTWSHLGAQEPHWSVLTEDRYRSAAWDAEARADFLQAGEGEVVRLEAWLARAGLPLPAGGTCVELGCGVGRITRGLARRLHRVVGLDVSAPHLAAAAAQLAADGIGNVDLVQLRGPADLGALDGADLFYSMISLQHSPPPIILDVLDHAFRGLRPGGIAFFQVPTYAPAYTYPEAEIHPGEMEVHFVPQAHIFALAQAAGLRPVEVQPDWCVGRLREWISNTFLFLKR